MKKSLTFIFLFLHALAMAQTISEKKKGASAHVMADLTQEAQQLLAQVNIEHRALNKQLHQLHCDACTLFQQNAPEHAYKDLLQQIGCVRAQINALEERWRQASSPVQEGYALWHQPNTTLEQLVIDYGSQDFVYIIPTEIATIPISVTSNLPIPRTSWDEMLELILSQNGIGIRQLNPYLRELYLLNSDRSALKLITNNRKDLTVFPANERVAFVLSPEPSDVRRIWFFLEKFINPHSVALQMIGRDILIVAKVSEIEELLKLYDFVVSNRGSKEYRAVALNRVDAEEMAGILSAIFGGIHNSPRVDRFPHPSTKPQDGKYKPKPFPEPHLDDDNVLKIIPLSNVARAIFLVGTREEICKAERIIFEVEEQVSESRGRVIFWYTAKHADPEELATVLFRIYSLMTERKRGLEFSDSDGSANSATQTVNIEKSGSDLPPMPPPPLADGYYLGPPIDDFTPTAPKPANMNRDNFIVDLKSGAIVMVVEADILPKIKDLIKKLDVPKKMVQLEILLFEKKVNRQNNFGLNLLRIGDCAKDCHNSCSSFNRCDDGVPFLSGIFDFLISRKAHHGVPAFDLGYRFLLAQEDVHINASPSVLAVNQTPAIIEIAEEISVSTGAFLVDSDFNGNGILKDSFARATYGIKIEITPTIHIMNEEDADFDPEGCDYVDLVTNLTFQTIKSNVRNRPDVITRHVMNEVSIPDGQTVILGGLRQRKSHDRSEKIPFLGELPGIGKLFSLTELCDDTTEMFIFITPKIVYDKCEDLLRMRALEMCRRPGDLPCFLCRLNEAQECEKNRLFHASMSIFLGRKPDRCVTNLYEDRILFDDCPMLPGGEYDGR